MRYLNGFVCALLALFTIVQYNDPDAILWIVIYGLPAIWAGFAAYRPNVFEHNHLLFGMLGLNLLADCGGRDLHVALGGVHLVEQRGSAGGARAHHYDGRSAGRSIHAMAHAAGPVGALGDLMGINTCANMRWRAIKA